MKISVCLASPLLEYERVSTCLLGHFSAESSVRLWNSYGNSFLLWETLLFVYYWVAGFNYWISRASVCRVGLNNLTSRMLPTGKFWEQRIFWQLADSVHSVVFPEFPISRFPLTLRTGLGLCICCYEATIMFPLILLHVVDLCVWSYHCIAVRTLIREAGCVSLLRHS
jgi:hypothetical protein